MMPLKIFNQFLIATLILSLGAPHTALSSPKKRTAQQTELDNEQATASELVNRFVKKYSKLNYPYTLNIQNLEIEAHSAALSSEFLNKVNEIKKIREQIRHSTDPKTMLLIDEMMAQKAEDAFIVAESIFSQRSIEQINLTLLLMMTDYVFKPKMRAPLSDLFMAIDSYAFSDEQLRSYEYRHNSEAQRYNGWTYALAALGVMAIWKVKNKIPNWINEFPTKIRQLFKNWNIQKQQVATNINSTSAPGAIEYTDLDFEKYLIQKGINIEKVIPQVKSESKMKGILTNFSKFRFTNIVGQDHATQKISSLSKLIGKFRDKTKTGTEAAGRFAVTNGKLALKSAVILGAGGEANVGLHAFLNYVNPTSATNTVMQPQSLRDDYFDHLAVLNLNCKTRALARKLYDTYSNETRADLMRSLIMYLTEYEILKEIAPATMQNFIVNSAIKVNWETKNIEFINPLDEKNQLRISCQERLADMSESKELSASLPDSLQDIITIYHSLSELENEHFTTRESDNNNASQDANNNLDQNSATSEN